MKLKKAFTLIELLIVVAIIAILAAIAVPNFLEAQTRSKISRAKADLRSLGTAMEAYCVDYNVFPPVDYPTGNELSHVFIEYARQLTTPTSYITNVALKDPFEPDRVQRQGKCNPDPDYKGSYFYVLYDEKDFWAINCHGGVGPFWRGFVILSNGPSNKWGWGEHYPFLNYWHNTISDIDDWNQQFTLYAPDVLYDASNGTKSRGSICRFGGEIPVQQSMGG
jgi:prepilin-type N-terminal cleavage/methylation domain-containing protein